MAERLQPDVVVVGGGTAGFGAAVAAGRRGLDVVLLEASSKIGGAWRSARGCRGEAPIRPTGSSAD